MIMMSGKALFAFEKSWRGQASIVCRKDVMDHTIDVADASTLQSQGVHLTACILEEDDSGIS